jgi:hypothetical protein
MMTPQMLIRERIAPGMDVSKKIKDVKVTAHRLLFDL